MSANNSKRLFPIVVALCFIANGAEATDQSESSLGTSITDTRAERCGPMSLVSCLLTLGHDTSLAEVEKLCGKRGSQTILLDCADAARQLGMLTTACRWDSIPLTLNLAEVPAILPIVLRNGRKHFIAAVAQRPGELLIIDYPFDPSWAKVDELRSKWRWDGTMLHIATVESVVERLQASAHRTRIAPVPFLLGLAISILGVCLWRGSNAPVACQLTTKESLSPTASSRDGFTIIEVLVVLGIISILLALSLPAIQMARESARRTSCTNNLHQLGIALESFNSATGKYPAASVAAANVQGQQISKNLSPHAMLLPYLDQASLFKEFNRDEQGDGIDQDPPGSSLNSNLLAKSVGVFECPSDGSTSPRCNYRICAGTSPFMHETTPRSPDAALQGYRSLFGRRDAELVDGASQTVAFSERLSGDRNIARYTPSRDLASIQTFGQPILYPDDAEIVCGRPMNPNPRHFSFVGTTWALSGYPQTWYNHVLTPNSYIPDCTGGTAMSPGAFTARSLHSGGVNVLFADGRVRFTGDKIDRATWRALATVNGSETTAEE